MNTTQLKLDLYNWVKDNSGLAANKIIWANQASPQPAPTYIVLEILTGPNQIGFDNQIYDSGSDSFSSCGIREFTLSIQAFGKTSHQELTDLLGKLNLSDSTDYFSTKNLSVINLPSVTNLTVALDNVFEERHGLDIIFNTSQEISSGISQIRNTEGSFEFSEPTITGNFEVQT
ncbi:unnamed protein product [marine sediment metagenome]|uniref:Phage neck terminator protein gp12-like domain-containing protein n=1 Tax=marine sediment metagenome TaxID=412755 RepID=X1AZ88_9ZZZZ